MKILTEFSIIFFSFVDILLHQNVFLNSIRFKSFEYLIAVSVYNMILCTIDHELQMLDSMAKFHQFFTFCFLFQQFYSFYYLLKQRDHLINSMNEQCCLIQTQFFLLFPKRVKNLHKITHRRKLIQITDHFSNYFFANVVFYIINLSDKTNVCFHVYFDFCGLLFLFRQLRFFGRCILLKKVCIDDNFTRRLLITNILQIVSQLSFILQQFVVYHCGDLLIENLCFFHFFFSFDKRIQYRVNESQKGRSIFQSMLNFTPQFFWVDLEMSGLDPYKNQILQFACVLTDKQLKFQEEGPHLIIHASEDHLKTMDQWNTTHHSQSGLWKNCVASQISTSDAQKQILTYLKKRGIAEGQLIIAGNSIHTDKLFLFAHMPQLHAFLHYRILDVSSLKLAVNVKSPNLFYKKKNSHRAQDDIRESIGEMKYYLTYAFK